jgi:hypothetical protein
MESSLNIFYVDTDPVKAAQSMVDKHVVKMIVESAQLLSTAHRVMDGVEVDGLSKSGRKQKKWILADSREPILYQATHINHPSAIWTRTSVENYNWLVDHFFGLLNEYTYRYKKHHKCEGDLSFMIQSPPNNLKDYDMTSMPSAMDDEFIISDNPIDNYRNYYRFGKAKLHKWTNRQAPVWINER